MAESLRKKAEGIKQKANSSVSPKKFVLNCIIMHCFFIPVRAFSIKGIKITAKLEEPLLQYKDTSL